MTKSQASIKFFCKNLLKFTTEFALPFAEMLDEKNGIFALRFASPKALEKFFVVNFDNFARNNLSTKVIGNALLVFPHGKAVRK